MKKLMLVSAAEANCAVTTRRQAPPLWLVRFDDGARYKGAVISAWGEAEAGVAASVLFGAKEVVEIRKL